MESYIHQPDAEPNRKERTHNYALEQEKIKSASNQNRQQLMEELATEQMRVLETTLCNRELKGGVKVLRDKVYTRKDTYTPPITTHGSFSFYDAHGNKIGSISSDLGNPPFKIRCGLVNTLQGLPSSEVIPCKKVSEVERFMSTVWLTLAKEQKNLERAAELRGNLDDLVGKPICGGQLQLGEVMSNGIHMYVILDPAGKQVGELTPTVDTSTWNAGWSMNLYAEQGGILARDKEAVRQFLTNDPFWIEVASRNLADPAHVASNE